MFIYPVLRQKYYFCSDMAKKFKRFIEDEICYLKSLKYAKKHKFVYLRCNLVPNENVFLLIFSLSSKLSQKSQNYIRFKMGLDVRKMKPV